MKKFKISLQPFTGFRYRQVVRVTYVTLTTSSKVVLVLYTDGEKHTICEELASKQDITSVELIDSINSNHLLFHKTIIYPWE